MTLAQRVAARWGHAQVGTRMMESDQEETAMAR